jgi:hypothetical protein
VALPFVADLVEMDLPVLAGQTRLQRNVCYVLQSYAAAIKVC